MCGGWFGTGHPRDRTVKREALDAGALEERILRGNKVAATAALQRQAAFRFSHDLEVVAFHAVWAANGIKIEHGNKGAKP